MVADIVHKDIDDQTRAKSDSKIAGQLENLKAWPATEIEVISP